MSKPKTEAAGDAAETRQSPLEALEQRALNERAVLDEEAAALLARRREHEAAIKDINLQLGAIANRRVMASAAYHAERERLLAEPAAA